MLVLRWAHRNCSCSTRPWELAERNRPASPPAFNSLVTKAEEASSTINFELGDPIPIAINAIGWDEEVIKDYAGLPTATFANEILTISVPPPPSSQYPAKSWWALDAPTITANQAYSVQADLRVSGWIHANIHIGLNARHGNGHPNWFQHLHADSGTANTSVYYGVWSDQVCATNFPIDGDWHTIQINWDGHNSVDYVLDGRTACSLTRTHQYILSPNDQQTLRIYVERYPDPNGPNYTVQVRRLAIAVAEPP